uniref:Si:zfos-1011f11.2 n=1 Tax=Sinocyclocheilus grahami TaxID=75366 RepID=A0A672KSL6_SINGR
VERVRYAAVSWCEAMQVSVRDERRFAMLFQSVVLPCHYTSVSSQTPVIQWWYKSYCHDLSRDAFRFPDTLAVHGSELGSSVHLDCGDSGQTVHIVASGQGSSITLAEHYKGRDISILNILGLLSSMMLLECIITRVVTINCEPVENRAVAITAIPRY